MDSAGSLAWVDDPSRIIQYPELDPVTSNIPDWNVPDVQEATLCFPVDGDRVLLIEKKRGVGSGLFNGPGGKVEAGETPLEAARREVREEIRTTVPSIRKMGALEFEMGGDPFMFVHVFRAPGIAGEPSETDEARPEWFEVGEIPYDQMWPDDRYWLPLLLDGRTFSGEFVFGDDEQDLREWDLETDVDHADMVRG